LPLYPLLRTRPLLPLSTSRFLFFFNHSAPTEIYTLSLHDALPISEASVKTSAGSSCCSTSSTQLPLKTSCCTSSANPIINLRTRSEEHTSELQSRFDLVCRLLLEKKKKTATQEM